MKKAVFAVGVLAMGLAAWWGLSYSSSNYHAVHAQASFRNVTIAMPDVKRLADFYKTTFAAEEINEPSWVPAGIVSGAVVLRTPGYRGKGPTLTMIPAAEPASPAPQASDNGFAHLCFESEDMRSVIVRLVAAGGSLSSVFEANDRAPVLYAKDPDGNAVEIHIPLPDPLTPRTIYRTLDSLVRTKLGMAAPSNDQLRFLHANHNSQDWKRVAKFYRALFGSETTGAERDYEGDFISELTGIRDVAVRGRHIEMPGYSAGGPTLEAFTYSRPTGRGALSLTDAGVVAVGFVTDDLGAMLSRVSAAGGSIISRDSNSAVARDIYENLIQFRQSAQKEQL